MENENPWISVDDYPAPTGERIRIWCVPKSGDAYETHGFTNTKFTHEITHWHRIVAPNQKTSLDPEPKLLKFWEAMREMQENHKRVRCLRWDRTHEKTIEWHLGDDIDLPSGMDWEDVMCEW